ncbi:MSEP-CTERM sorting domain-containing protein [uncultured Pedobacter sp.]|uniref:MSEP-CTERM sorting domain-containing protein n=1 Tax=uncultured Pedobacter sp. TaxID=246139 RepID=UPI0025DCF10A|nr:MSEP-CTERM sorting domain-containing protein [uncultured Pedobacter sp.]
MKNLLNPKWLIVISIIPSIILLLLFYGQFSIIKSLLKTETVEIWLNFSLTIMLLTCAQLAYTLFSRYKKYNISIFYAFFSLLAYTIFLYAYAQYADIIIPFSVPQWMINVDVILYPGTFLMPTLIHSLFILVEFSSRKSRSSSAWLSFMYGISIPILGYVFLQIVLPLWKKPESSFDTNVLMILFIIASVLFLFFICRGIYIITKLNTLKFSKYIVFIKVLIAIILPIVGLLINNGRLRLTGNLGESIFGNFSSIWFYIIAIINGILVCLPSFRNVHIRLLRFLALAICFPYTLYFFLVFLPYLPLAIIAIIVIGAGFLMLAPLCLFVVQINELLKDFNALARNYSRTRLTAYTSIALLTIPVCITTLYLHDRYVLNKALEYVYNPDYAKKYNIDKQSLARTLLRIRQQKGRSNSLSEEKSPFLTPYYNWLVFDNLVLSENKINTLMAIFLGESEQEQVPAIQTTSKVKISKISSVTKFNQAQQAWISNIDLELTNPEQTNLESYETAFILPEGCWISNFYLNIGNRKEYGILAEKKAALWVFSQIRNENRDPGILYYLTGNKIAFKVFPFSSRQTRKSGIELIHKVPINLKIDNKIILLGDSNTPRSHKIESINGTVYLPAAEKAKLKLIKRRPEYHFIIDVSKTCATSKAEYVKRINNFISKNQIDQQNIRLNFVSTFNEEIAYTADWKDKLYRQSFDGGFYLEGAIKKILVENYTANSSAHPIMVVVSNTLAKSILQNDLANFKITYPESDDFYELDQSGNLYSHSLVNKPEQRLNAVQAINNPAVYCWPDPLKTKAYLANDGQPSIIIDRSIKAVSQNAIDKRNWLSGLNLHGMWLKSQINCEQYNQSQLNLIKQSMRTGFLSRSTSYLVVENEAQKQMLKKKQNQILSGNKNLDPDEDTQSMDEPNLYILITIIIMFFLCYSRNKLNFSSKTNSN